MKLINIILFFFCCTRGIGQIKDIDGPGNEYAQAGVYYRDLNHILDPFVGTFIYSNGTTTFEIVLQKKLHSSNGNQTFTFDPSHPLIGINKKYTHNTVKKHPLHKIKMPIL